MRTPLIALSSRKFRAAARRAAPVASALAFAVLAPAAHADKIANPTAVFDGLDKITGRIISFEVALNETVQFGTLQITPRVCYSRPPTEQPQTDVFAQVDEIDEKKEVKRIFSGWMFADSPGLHGVEHPIYDVWLTDCKGGTTVIREAPQVEASAPDTDAPADEATDANGQASPQAQAPAAPKKRKPKAPTVVAAPSPPPGDSNAPLELGGASNSGNARSR
ncbi:MAG: DUF2155 domain-containing protein [Hyphomicrobiales bacterium]|nr:DUF2155 domain-containing protein [Hyphomicrobiales bacterium]MBV8439569.1 DUF2155 domain-containing protein [Hyphomicrobiales bacterium]